VYRSPEFWELVEFYSNTRSAKVKAFDDSAPPLTETQRERLALLLNSNR
jgi:hypothetical protein